MAEKLQKLMREIAAVKKTSFSWQRGEEASQDFYLWQDGCWTAVKPGAALTSTSTHSSFSILSWNIDFMRSYTQERMQVALDYLRKYISQLSKPAIIMLNEMMVSDLELIQGQDWVRESFGVTDISSEFWESGYYGTCILFPKDLPVSKVFRVHYEDTAMERDGLFVDINIQGSTLRVCSTHLESLIAKPPKRPSQLATSAKFMHQASASILGGDLNAIEPFDKKLHSDNNLKDAYLEYGGVEDDVAGMTWGQMAPKREREMFGLSRMDKLMFCGSIELEHFETFGMDVQLDDGDLARKMTDEEGIEKPWVTDHLGVRGDFSVAGLENAPKL